MCKLCLLILVCLPTLLYGQYSPPDSNPPPPSSNQQGTQRVGSIFYGQPGKAALYSLIAPGGGQIYNKRYWKAPIIWGIEGFAFLNLSESISNTRNATSCWQATIPNSTEGDISRCSESVLNSSSQNSTAFSERQSARSRRDVAWILMSAAHLLNIVEAFVDRHLINFDTSEDLSFHNIPNKQVTERFYNREAITIFRFTASLGR